MPRFQKGELAGTATLVSGQATVNTPAVFSRSNRVFVSRNTPGGTVGDLSVANADLVVGSFVIKSASALDTSTVNWWIQN